MRPVHSCSIHRQVDDAYKMLVEQRSVGRERRPVNEIEPAQTEGTSFPNTRCEEGRMRARILVTGINDQLGHMLMTLLPQAGFEPAGVDLSEVDISDAVAMSSWNWSGYNIIISATARTDVGGAETPEGCRLSW